MKKLLSSGFLGSSDYDLAKSIVIALKADPGSWNQLSNLNSKNSSRWSNSLYKILRIKRLHKNHVTLVDAIILMSSSWENGLAKTIDDARNQGIPLADFFKLERTISFGLATLVHDINAINREIFGSSVDVSPFAAKAAHAFLPVLVYQLEEYGLPRIISRKIQNSGLIDLESEEKSIHEVILEFLDVGLDELLSIQSLDAFDQFILKYFHEGINPS